MSIDILFLLQVDIKLRQTSSVLKVFDDSVKDIINESIGKNIPKRIQAGRFFLK